MSSNRRVIARIKGGLGNQLFGYSAARRLALVNNIELVIDDVSGFMRDQTYRRSYQLDHFQIPCRKATAWERLEPFSRMRRYVKRLFNGKRSFEERTYIQQEGCDFDIRLLQVKPGRTVHIEGDWQSESYFKDVESTIRSDLRITPPTDIDNLEMGARIRGGIAVAVHVRFFDVPNGIHANNAPSDYYERAVAQIEKLVPGAHYFVFSDHPDAGRSRIPLPNSRITCVSHNRGDGGAYADLWLMTQCQHFIIANSTFSWWGAWLAENTDKRVIAPGFERREGSAFWGFKGLIPERWITQ